MKEIGNKYFSTQEYEISMKHYSEAIQMISDSNLEDMTDSSAILFANRAACFLKLKQFEEVIKDCTKALELKPAYSKAIQRRALAFEELDKLTSALEDYQSLLKLEPTSPLALEATRRLPPLIKQHQEKEKEEMLGKLKELGNSFLGTFGLSVDSFGFEQDPTSGSFSVQLPEINSLCKFLLSDKLFPKSDLSSPKYTPQC